MKIMLKCSVRCLRTILLPTALGLLAIQCATPRAAGTAGQSSADPAVTALVNELAQAKRHESGLIGFDSSPSKTYATSRELARRVQKHEAVALLKHPSPVVRAYLIQHVMAAFPEEADAVFPLLSDQTIVETLGGCELDWVPQEGNHVWISLGRDCQGASYLCA